MCCVLFFSSIASFTCSAADDIFTTSPDLYSYKGEEVQQFVTSEPLIDYFDCGYGIRASSSGASMYAAAPAAAAAASSATITGQADWRAKASVLSDVWLDKNQIYTYIMEQASKNKGDYPTTNFGIDDVGIFSVNRVGSDNIYFFAYLKTSKHAIRFYTQDANLRVQIGCASPVIGWAINPNTNQYVGYRSVTGVNPLFATYYGDSASSRTISGLNIGGYTSITFTKNYYYVDYAFNSVNGGAINVVSDVPLTGSTDGGMAFPVSAWGYTAYPTPESYQYQVEEERHKGILGSITSLGDKIKGFFDNLASKIKGFFDSLLDGIKSLFIPSEDYFSDYVAQMRDFFKERFGFLYQLPEAVVSIFQKLISFNPKTSDYSMTFPSLSAPSVGKNGEVEWHKLTDETTFSFDFIENQPFSTLYTGYRSFIWLAYCVILLNFIVKKWNQIVGGSD